MGIFIVSDNNVSLSDTDLTNKNYKIMKSRFFLKEEFTKWLIEEVKIKANAADSYCSYVSSVDNTISLIDKKGEKHSLFEVVEKHIKNEEYIASIVEYFITELNKEGISETIKHPLSTISNWKTGLSRYREFLIEYITDNVDLTDQGDDIVVAEEEQDIVSFSEDANYVYSKEYLYGNFKLRLITQDRYYSDILYPIGLVKRLFYFNGEKVYFDKWIENMLDNVDVLLDSKQIKLKSISDIEIRHRNVYACIDGKKEVVFTESLSHGKATPFQVINLEQISLDHKTALHRVMNENIDQLPVLQQLTTQIRKQIKGNITYKKMKATYTPIMKSDFVKSINIADLKSELEFISSKTDMQLMDRVENTKKGKSM